MRVSSVLATVVALLVMAQAAPAQTPPPSPSAPAAPASPGAPDVTILNRAPERARSTFRPFGTRSSGCALGAGGPGRTISSCSARRRSGTIRALSPCSA